MSIQDAVALLKTFLPLEIKQLVLPPQSKIGLVIVDVVNGFCTVGAGNLAPSCPDEQISNMVAESLRLAKEFTTRGLPILALTDSHDPAKPEHPYPLHCIVGTGEEELVPELKWLEHDAHATIMPKDCINGFVGAIQANGSNIVVDWIKNNSIEQILVVGICTDICVLDFVTTIVSARNHGIAKPLQDIFVYSKGCATYDLPLHIAKELGALSHPQDLTHHMGLYLAFSRGALIMDKVEFSTFCD